MRGKGVPDLNQYIKFLKPFEPLPPSQIPAPSQIARNYRSQAYGIEYRASLWNKPESFTFARAFLAGDETLSPAVAELSDAFWKRFFELPGEGESAICGRMGHGNRIKEQDFETGTRER